MKTVTAALKAHLAGTNLTVSTLWKVTRTDGQVFGFTDNSRDVVYSGVTYRAGTGHTASAIKTTSTLSVDNLEVMSVLDSDTITEADIQAGLWDAAVVKIMIVNYKDLSTWPMGHMLLRKGTIGEIKTGRSRFTAELRGMMQPLQQSTGRVYSPTCDADFGDTRCGVNAASYTVAGSVTTPTSSRIFTDTARTEPNGYFDNGLLTWTGGDNATYRMEVKTSTAAGVITLQQAMPNDISLGDTYNLVAGCDKLSATCKNKFANLVNFRGFPHVPGTDAIISGHAV